MVEIQRIASSAIGQVLAGRSLDAVLAAAWSRQPQLGERERAVIRDLVYGTLRFLGKLEAFLDALLERPLRDARLRALLLTALYQLEHTRAAHHAVVDHAVQCAVRLGLTSAKGLVNAVLRAFLRSRAELTARAQRLETARYSHPQWWIDRLKTEYPARYQDVLESVNLHPPLTVRVNRRRTTVADYLHLLEERAVPATLIGESAVSLPVPVPAARIPGFTEGLVSVQDAAAQLAARLLDVAGGQRVLDACAAPGGKTTHILELSDANLTAVDADAVRLARVQDNLTRLGLAARLVRGDAAEPAAWWDGEPYDRILADVPCSASGVARRHPDVKWLRRAGDIRQFAAAQRRILDALWQLLRRDGKLLYVTCSVFHEENHLQVERFLQAHPDAHRLKLAAAVTDLHAPAGQLLPDRLHDGFFHALLQKT